MKKPMCEGELLHGGFHARGRCCCNVLQAPNGGMLLNGPGYLRLEARGCSLHTTETQKNRASVEVVACIKMTREALQATCVSVINLYIYN